MYPPSRVEVWKWFYQISQKFKTFHIYYYQIKNTLFNSSAKPCRLIKPFAVNKTFGTSRQTPSIGAPSEPLVEAQDSQTRVFSSSPTLSVMFLNSWLNLSIIMTIQVINTNRYENFSTQRNPPFRSILSSWSEWNSIKKKINLFWTWWSEYN